MRKSQIQLQACKSTSTLLHSNVIPVRISALRNPSRPAVAREPRGRRKSSPRCPLDGRRHPCSVPYGRATGDHAWSRGCLQSLPWSQHLRHCETFHSVPLVQNLLFLCCESPYASWQGPRTARTPDLSWCQIARAFQYLSPPPSGNALMSRRAVRVPAFNRSAVLIESLFRGWAVAEFWSGVWALKAGLSLNAGSFTGAFCMCIPCSPKEGWRHMHDSCILLNNGR